MPHTALTILKGVAAYFDKCQKINIEAVDDDQDEEIESMVNSFQVDTVVKKVFQASDLPAGTSTTGPAQKYTGTAEAII